jgi:hypothetical protein
MVACTKISPTKSKNDPKSPTTKHILNGALVTLISGIRIEINKVNMLVYKGLVLFLSDGLLLLRLPP